jgi:hypothetical protein
MDDLVAAYQATDYRVRLARGGWASIRIGEALPADLLPMVGDQPWGFITAWNPMSQPLPRQRNRAAQRLLLKALGSQLAATALHPAMGVGSNGLWREPSLFVVGLDGDALDRLAHRFEQRAYVYGQGSLPARLRLMPAPAGSAF